MNLDIYIVEDDKEACQRFLETAKKFNNLTLVGTTDNADIGYEYILTNNPDVVILDLELNSGVGNGLELLSKLSRLNDHQKPYIIITTNNSNKTTYDFAHKNGSGLIFFKHQSGYSELSVLNHIDMIKESILFCRNQVVNTCIDKNELESTLRKYIMDNLDSVGINVSSVGYGYLCEAVYYTIFNKNDTQMFALLSKKYNKTSTSLEQAMRNALISAWSKKNSIKAHTEFPHNLYQGKEYPAPRTFIFYYAERLRNEHHILVDKLTSH